MRESSCADSPVGAPVATAAAAVTSSSPRRRRRTRATPAVVRCTRRDDDTADAIHQRFRVYEEQNARLTAFYRDSGVDDVLDRFLNRTSAFRNRTTDVDRSSSPVL